jgi:hypothetical protein
MNSNKSLHPSERKRASFRDKLLNSRQTNKPKRISKLKKRIRELRKPRKTDWLKKLRKPRELPLRSESNWRRPTTDTKKPNLERLMPKTKSRSSKRRSRPPKIEQ